MARNQATCCRPRGRIPTLTMSPRAEVIITGVGPQQRVAVLFSYQDFPGVRFGHRFPPDPGLAALERIWLKEEIETGALDRMMQTPPAADEAGIIWTTWEDADQD